MVSGLSGSIYSSYSLDVEIILALSECFHAIQKLIFNSSTSFLTYHEQSSILEALDLLILFHETLTVSSLVYYIVAIVSRY